MINIGPSFFSGFDRTILWEKGVTTLDQILHSPWTKWSIAGGGACIAAFAISRLKARLAPLDKQLALLASNPNPDQLMKLFQVLTPLRGHWFYAKRWTTLKNYLQSYSIDQFCEKLIEHQIADPKNDWLSPASELISFEQLSSIYNVDEEQLKRLAAHLAKALENPPEDLKTLRSILEGYMQTSVTYSGHALHSFASTFLNAHDFSSEESQSLVQRHEARWHLTSFYEMIEKPAILILSIFSYLEPKTRFSWIPYIGTLCFILVSLSLIKIFSVVLKKKKPTLSHDFRNLTEEAKLGTLPVPLDCPEVFQIANCFTPLNKDSLSVLLIGPPGVGKDALVHAFVHAIEEGLFPLLNDVDVRTANTSEFKEGGGGTNHLYFSRMQIFLKDLEGKEHSNIMFMNEIHTLNPKKDQPGNRSELGQQIKTVIETGKLHVIGATTLQEYKDHIEWDIPLDRRFVKIFLKPSSNCFDILEAYLAEQYPTVTIETDAIKLALSETNKIYLEVAQPSKAKQLLAQAARSVIGNYGKLEEELVKESAGLEKGRRALKRNPNDSIKAAIVAELAEKVKEKKNDLNTKRKELDVLTDLKNYRAQSQERLTRLAHRISAQPNNSAIEKKTFLLARKLLNKIQITIEDTEKRLEKKGIRIKVDVKLVNEMLTAQQGSSYKNLEKAQNQ